MSRKQLVLALSLLISLASTHATMMYEIIDLSDKAPGGNKYASELSTSYKGNVLLEATEEVLYTFNQKEGEGKKYATVTLLIESFGNPLVVASTTDNIIRLNADYLQSFCGDVKEEFAGVVYHEMTHVWQWTGNGMAPRGLINGIADYVRLKSGYGARGWLRMGSGSSWDDGYAVTAYFLVYCNDLKHDFVAELNALMKDSYSEAFFFQLLGKSVHELWHDYKLAYGTARIPSRKEGYRKPYTHTHHFDNSIPRKTADVPKSNPDLKSPENNGYFRIEVDGVVLDTNNFQQNVIAKKNGELSAMLEKNDALVPSTEFGRNEPLSAAKKGRTSRSEMGRPVTDW